MKAFEAIRRNLAYEMSVPASRERVFPLLCPAREYDWLPGWRCRLVYSATGRAEPGCVFQTDLASGSEATWLVTAYEPPQRIQFAAVKAGSHSWILEITLSSLKAACRLTWRHTFTALTTAGNEFLTQYTDEQHRLRLQQIEQCLVYFLQTGRCVPVASRENKTGVRSTPRRARAPAQKTKRCG